MVFVLKDGLALIVKVLGLLKMNGQYNLNQATHPLVKMAETHRKNAFNKLCSGQM